MTDNNHRAGDDPVRLAQIRSKPPLPKRFYDKVSTGPALDDGLSLLLDGRSARTPAKNLLVLPTSTFADAVCVEWVAQESVVDPATMPATRLANSAIDGVAPRMDEVRGEILKFCGNDMLFYRAGEPTALADWQAAAWDPLIDWAGAALGASFVLTEGVVHCPQPQPSLSRVAAELDRFDAPFRLAGLHIATTLTGSALIALALSAGHIDGDAAWLAAHVDENWNIDQWGQDKEAVRRQVVRRRDFDAAVLALEV
ncbi:MAG: ATP12 family chaperone protein [Alphaproteobacteria bacterium]